MCGSGTQCTGLLYGQTRTPKTHRLEATPSTVAYGYYWSEAKPALRIASGDIIDVDTLLTNSPTGLARAGVPDDKIQASLKAIVTEVTGDRRGPGGHILTGPVYVEGAEPGDVLEVKILSIDFAIDYGYNGCSGFIPENCDRSQTLEDHADRQEDDDVGVRAGHRDSAAAVLRQHGRRAGAGARPRQQQSAGPARRQPGQQGAGRRLDAVHSGVRARRALRDRRRPRRAGRRRSGSDRDRNVAARPAAAHRAQGHEADVAARRDGHRLHQHGAPIRI